MKRRHRRNVGGGLSIDIFVILTLRLPKSTYVRLGICEKRRLVSLVLIDKGDIIPCKAWASDGWRPTQSEDPANDDQRGTDSRGCEAIRSH